MQRTRIQGVVASFLIVSVHLGCSSPIPSTPSVRASNTSDHPAPPLNQVLAATVTIRSSGVTPAEVELSIGGRVTFVNEDSRPHEMLSDPDLTHSDCPEINGAGYLSPGQSRQSRPFETAKTCGFHDHFQPLEFRGRVTVK